ncbi:hypothetical protein K438DRAFT_1159201 [Mycena galopus ATCC 62051]|nr:hypothetical protein K438DRAFT_1159201 [Mycena galopus ATCC 62051]
MAVLLPSARLGTFISILHTILQLFLPKRTKINVLGPFLPPKKRYISFYVRLSTRQREAYEAVLDEVAGGARAKGASASTPAGVGVSTSVCKVLEVLFTSGRSVLLRCPLLFLDFPSHFQS